MKRAFLSALRNLFRKNGFDIVRYHGDYPGNDPYADIKRFLARVDKPVICDIGGNLGQSVDWFRWLLPKATIYTFEPSPKIYKRLQAHCKSLENVHALNVGIGSELSTLTFQVNEHSNMSSFLNPGSDNWGKVIAKIDVPVITLDSFALERKLDHINIIKCDTQGFELEVFKGASGLFKENKVDLIYFEYIFSELYKELPPFDHIYRFLCDNNFSMVAIYDANYQNEQISWVDMLFINNDFNRRR